MLHIPDFLIPHFRTNHAGEMGAVYIYRAILTFSKHKDIILFSKKHLHTESQHLKKIEKILPSNERSKLIFLWKFFGFMTGFIPSILGKKFIYATIYSVESFVESHYQVQIDLLKKKKNSKELILFIKKLMDDEIEHKDEAFLNIEKFNVVHKLWGSIVKFGSISAVKISKFI